MYEYEKHGLGKKRSRFGQFIDKNSISQQLLARKSGVSNSTISRLCHPEEYEPSIKNAMRIIKVLKEDGYQVDFDDFWSS
ncbi:helix-turn-helix transcriptional regulator [Peribacillus simplex]|uniref:helix-turn-helix transcriptional regulator n=1 Tax=Peribacillus simplex TaxID=1478 RepID=UPI002989B98B|nr:helix-turn-helix transcriptional regulator [Peribacillus simplex]MBX9955074.1 helix-turn-helix transcriptional regulator [Peribacillus simplex]